MEALRALLDKNSWGSSAIVPLHRQQVRIARNNLA